MLHSAVLPYWFLNTILLISGHQVPDNAHSFSTVSSSDRPIHAYTIVSKLIISGGTSASTLSNIQTEDKTLGVKRRTNNSTFGNGKVPLPSATRPRSRNTARLQHRTLSTRHRRGIISGLVNTISGNLKVYDPATDQPFGQNSQSSGGVNTQASPPAPTTIASRVASSSQAPAPTQAANPVATPIATPIATPAPTSDSSKPQPAINSPAPPNTITSSTKTSVSLQPTARPVASGAAKSAPSATATHPAIASPPAQNAPAPQTLNEKVVSLFKSSSSRLSSLAIIILIGLVLASLTIFITTAKCICRRKRFANKKDYPDGFPWAELIVQLDRGDGGAEVEMSNASFMSTRKSTLTNVYAPHDHFNLASRANSHYVDYQPNALRLPSGNGAREASLRQASFISARMSIRKSIITSVYAPQDLHYVDHQLNELKSSSDVASNHLDALGEQPTEPETKKSPDHMPSTSSTEESSQLSSSEPHQEDEKWIVQSVNGSSYFVQGATDCYLDQGGAAAAKAHNRQSTHVGPHIIYNPSKYQSIITPAQPM